MAGARYPLIVYSINVGSKLKGWGRTVGTCLQNVSATNLNAYMYFPRKVRAVLAMPPPPVPTPIDYTSNVFF